MKLTTRLLILFAFGLALFSPMSVGKAALVSYSSGINVQNLDSTTATVYFNYYLPNGNLAVDPAPSTTVAPYDSKTIFPLTDPPAGFNGSMVISSASQINAVSRITGSDGSNTLAFGAAYSGFKGGTTSSYLPILMYANFGFNTWYSVQNIGSAATNISVTYSDGKTATFNNLEDGAAIKFDQKTEAHATGWVGSGVVTSSSQPIAVIVINLKDDTAGRESLMASSGFSGGSKTPVFPTVQENNYTYMTGISIQNMGGSTTQVKMDYTPSLAGTACYEIRNINAGQRVSFGMFVFSNDPDPNPGSLVAETCTAGQYFVGQGRVTSNSTNQDLASNVNKIKYSSPYKAGAVIGQDPNSGTPTVAFASILDRVDGYFSGINLMNVGTSDIPAAQLVCTVRGIDGLNNPVNLSFTPSATVPAGAGWTKVFDGVLPNGTVGSAICTGPTGSKLVGVSNYLHVINPGDTLYAYEGFNK